MDNESITGLDQLMAKLEALKHIATADIYDEISNTIIEDAKQLCPVSTGALQNSITATVTTDTDTNGIQLDISAGNDEIDYAPFVELGTSKMAARPFLFPAVQQNQDNIVSSVSTKLNENIKGVTEI